VLNVESGVYSAGFGKYDVNEESIDGGTLANADVAFAVFTTAEFSGDSAGWLADLGLANGDVVYLMAGNGDTVDITDDAQLLRVEGTDTNVDTQLLANFENLDLNNFLDDNWNTNYSIA
jgi:hypothetical protein